MTKPSLRPLFSSRRTYLTVLFLVAFLVRFVILLGLRDIHKFHGPNPGGIDAVEFNQIALHLASGQGYTINPGVLTSFRAPGMPFFLSVLYRLSYENYVLVYLSIVLIGALTCVLAYLIAREILPEGLAQASGFLAAFYLPHVYFSTILLSEVLFAFCVGMALWLVLLYLRTPRLWLVATAGLFLGYSALARPIGLELPIFFLPALIRWAGPNLGRLVRSAVPLGLAAAAVLIPWAVRNYDLHNHLVLVATNGGSTFYGANNDFTLHDKRYMGYWIATNYLPHRKEIDATPDEYSHDQLEWKLGKDWVATHLVDLPLTTAYKMARFWLPDWASPNRKYVLMQVAGYTPWGILMFVGLFVCLRSIAKVTTSGWLAVHGVLAANLSSSMVFYGAPRFRDSITPVLMVYAAVGLGWVVARFSKQPPGCATL